MASISGQCCATGSLHTGTPTGKEMKIHGLNTYVATPPGDVTPRGIVVIIPDIFGWTFPNARILADEYAKRAGVTTYLPDVMFTKPLDPSYLISIEALNETGIRSLFRKIYHGFWAAYGMIPFMITHRQSKLDPHLTQWFQALRDAEGADQPIAASGFCWGGPPVIRLCSNSARSKNGKRQLVDVGIINHAGPYDVPGDIEKLAVPTSWVGATKDMGMNVKNGKETEKLFGEMNRKAVEKDGIKAVVHEYKWYEGFHGFAIRADENDKVGAASGKKAEDQAVQWIARWFGEWTK